MEPLRVALNEKTSLKVQAAPQAIKDAVEKQHNIILLQVQKFYAQKQRELELFAERKIHEYENPVQPSMTIERPRHIKSIVKRRPSSSEKRVSFSDSPPLVEVFSKTEEHDDDGDDDGIDYRPLTEGGGSASSQAADPSSREQDPTRSDQEPAARSVPSGTDKESDKGSDRALATTPTQPDMPAPYSFKASKPFLPLLETSQRLKQQENGRESGDTQNTEQELFAFEDVIESPSSDYEPSLSVNNHHAAQTGGESPELLTSERRDSQSAEPSEDEQEHLRVGSAPVAIRAKHWGLEGDGGPPPKTEAERLEERNEAIELSKSSMNLPDSMDPSQMSFSQRMELENFRKLQGDGVF